MAGWTSPDRDLIDWDGTIRAKKYIGDGSGLTGVAGTGEINTGSSVGTGAGIFKEKSGVDLVFKSLAASGANIYMNSGANQVWFEFSGALGEINTASNLSDGGQGLFSAKSGVDLQFKRIMASGANLIIGASGNLVYVENTGTGGGGGGSHWTSSALALFPANNAPRIVSGANFATTGTISAGAMNVANDQTISGAAYVANIVFGTNATPPTASNFPEGTIYVQYV